MKTRPIFRTTIIVIACVFYGGYASSQDFQVTEIFDKIFKVESLQNGEDGEEQIVIASDQGLVVLNSFSSEPTARRLKAGIVETLKRDDFLYLINIVDRLDRCGGNGAYEGIPIIGHRGFWDNYRDNNSIVDAEVKRMIEMWRWKESVARERLPNHEPGSEQAIGEQEWINTCKRRAEELESGFSFLPPTETYDDRMTLDLGDITLNLIWFGRAKGDAISVIVIPEKKLAILPDDLLSPLHLAPYPHPRFKALDVTRWIEVLEEILEGDNPVENVLLCDFLNVVWSRDRAHLHLDYIRKLWSAVRKADAAGKSLEETDTQLSLDNDFAFVKEMPVYIDRGDEWVRPQHRMHVRLFFLQGKTLASAMIENALPDSLSAALAEIRKLKNEGADIFIEEAAINGIGYYLLGAEKLTSAVEVFELNVELFPESFNVYDSYAEALMKSGDTQGAIVNYKKSLALNPDNTHALNMLKELSE
ncbi:MAG: hypothetical protein JSV52_12510 [Candidatus Zixiibacteriota bacterium]|nr:MAG: hypothetical protein JSV52_12510 [candidate division Zixibacteria bacterium]